MAKGVSGEAALTGTNFSPGPEDAFMAAVL